MKNPQDIIARYLPGRTGVSVGNALVVKIEEEDLAPSIRALFAAVLPLVVMFAEERKKPRAFRIHYVFTIPGEEKFLVPFLELADSASFPSLAREFPGLALYEREIQSMFGLTAKGHPDPRSLVMHEENWDMALHPLCKDFAWDTKLPETKSGLYCFNVVEGEGIYEIPVGPVHAGIIEPGHFRFSVAGEEILSLEARLGWVHKGVEKLFETLSIEKGVQLSERISGDSAFSHSLAFCQALETLGSAKVPARAHYLRLIFAELERLTMHIFDVGNIAGNGTGFSFMAAQCFRIVEDMRRNHEFLAGSRFLRGINTLGGVTKDITSEKAATLRTFLAGVEHDFNGAMRVADQSVSLANRLKGTGVLPQQVALDLGALGIAARSVGIARDVRIDHPYAAYADINPHIALETAGDVDARYRVRVKEIAESFDLIERALSKMPKGSIQSTLPALPKEGMAISVVEGWRGEIAYAVIVEKGALSRIKVRDPSFINWQLFPHMVSTDMVPDFPLINKSLNLSYTGNDL